MNKTQDIHNYTRTLERLVERIKESDKFSEEDKRVVLGFRNELLAQNISISKTGRYLQECIWLNKQLNGKNFEEMDGEDVKQIVANMNQSSLSEHTKKGTKVFLRKFYKFIREVGANENISDRCLKQAVSNSFKSEGLKIAVINEDGKK